MKKRIAFVLVCLLISSALAACGPSQEELDAQATQASADSFATQTAEAPTPTPMGGGSGQIVFVSERDGNQEIYVMNADGSEQTNLTNDKGDDGWPTISPDGAQLVFVSGRDEPRPGLCTMNNECSTQLYMVNTDGTGLTQLTDEQGQKSYPAWSPDGKRIVFMSNSDGGYDVFVMNTDGSEQVNLTNNWVWGIYPAWVSDGSNIVVLALHDGSFQYFVMNADGSQRGLLDSGLSPGTGSNDGIMAWLEDTSKYQILYFEKGGDAWATIQDTGSALGEFPAWSPDGTKVAFHSNRDGNMEIYVANADRSELTRLTNNDVSDMFPTWSPDGTQIAFQSNRDGNADIYVMNADGSNPTRLTDNPKSDLLPAWYP